ncbi:hypothetical protein EB73_07220 [Mycobacterium sp. SWH-M3]|nr:hypothetical protein EB73_07220 [Mycobacterium sp. SWH-M3]
MDPRPTTSDRRLTANQIDMLRQFGSELRWLRPLDLGGRDGSNHSAVLAQLQRRGLVESKVRSHGTRGSKLYRITPAGRHALLVHTATVCPRGGLGRSTAALERPPTTADRCRALAAQLESTDPTRAASYRHFAEALDRGDRTTIRDVSASINHTDAD